MKNDKVVSLVHAEATVGTPVATSLIPKITCGRSGMGELSQVRIYSPITAEAAAIATHGWCPCPVRSQAGALVSSELTPRVCEVRSRGWGQRAAMRAGEGTEYPLSTEQVHLAGVPAPRISRRTPARAQLPRRTSTHGLRRHPLVACVEATRREDRCTWSTNPTTALRQSVSVTVASFRPRRES